MTDEPPPVLGSWNRLYALVLGELLLCVLFFYLFTQVFS